MVPHTSAHTYKKIITGRSLLVASSGAYTWYISRFRVSCTIIRAHGATVTHVQVQAVLRHLVQDGERVVGLVACTTWRTVSGKARQHSTPAQPPKQCHAQAGLYIRAS